MVRVEFGHSDTEGLEGCPRGGGIDHIIDSHFGNNFRLYSKLRAQIRYHAQTPSASIVLFVHDGVCVCVCACVRACVCVCFCV